MKKPQFAVPVAAPPKPSTESWVSRMSQTAAWGSEQCRSHLASHSAICTITGTPEQLVINLACTAKSENALAELVEFSTDRVIPEMEHRLGVQFEVRNLQFAVAGHENLVSEPEHADEANIPSAWLDHPFQAPEISKFDLA